MTRSSRPSPSRSANPALVAQSRGPRAPMPAFAVTSVKRGVAPPPSPPPPHKGGGGEGGRYAPIAVQLRDAVAGDAEIGKTVIVEISDGAAHQRARRRQAGLRAHVAESPVAFVVVEGDAVTEEENVQ